MDSWTIVVFFQLTTVVLIVHAQQTRSSSAADDTVQLLIPGKGHVHWLPHSVRPPLQEIHSLYGYYRRRHKRQQEDDDDDQLPQPTNTTISDLIQHHNFNQSHGHHLRGGMISDREIVVIVVCSSIGLVICLLGAAISAKFYWIKVRRESGGHYEGVMQKDISAEDVPPTHRDKDGRVGQMFAQIDEMDEEGGSCPSSPAKILQNGGDLKLSVELATPTCPQPTVQVENVMEDKVAEVVTVEVELVSNSCSSSSSSSSTVSVAEEEKRVYCRTGLSQSDCSLSSYTSVNPSYKYGNQVAYLGGYYGYTMDELTSPDSNDFLLPLLLQPTSTCNPTVVVHGGGHRFNIPIPREEVEEDVDTVIERQSPMVNSSSAENLMLISDDVIAGRAEE